MRALFSIVAATTAVLATAVRAALNNIEVDFVDDIDAGTPIPPISAKLVENYAYVGATDTDIADRFLMEEAEIRRRYANVLRVARVLHRINLRKEQMEGCKKHNPSLLTWLGRNILGQSLNPTSPGVPMPEIIEAEGEDDETSAVQQT